MLSIIIPSRSPQYLQKTVTDLLDKAEGEIEVIVVLDGIWPEAHEMPPEDDRVVVIHHGEVHNNIGMRGSINAGMAIARGTHVMKVDEHTMVGEGFDTILKADCDDNMVVIPRRKRLDPETWTLIQDGRPDIDYMYIEYPYAKPQDKTQGLHGAEWKRPERADIMIDDTPTMQGSGYFMKKSTWDQYWPDGLDDENYGPFTQEAQEITNTVWLNGGRVIVNKNTFYAHFHKGSKGKGYGFSNEQYKKHSEQNEKGRIYCIEKWLAHPKWDWFVTEKFPDMPGWSKDWREQVKIDREKDYSTTGYKDDYWLQGLRENR